MAIEGPLRELGIHDVFQLLDLSRKTGRLRVTSALRDNEGTVDFRQGRVVGAAIRSNPHPLGQVLLRAGKITEAELERADAIRRQTGEGRRLGEVLVDIGAITRRELERMIQRQIEAVVFELLSWQEGFFSFAEGDPGPGIAAGGGLSTDSLLMEAARRIDEWARIAHLVPSLAVVPMLADSAADQPPMLDLRPNEWQVLAAIDGATDLRTIAAAAGMSDFDVARVVYGLVSTGVVALRETRTAGEPRDDAVMLLSDAREALADDRALDALAAAERALVLAPHAAESRLVAAQALVALERYSEAEALLERAMALEPESRGVPMAMARLAVRRGDLGRAIDCWTQVMRGAPGSPEARQARDAIAHAARLHALVEVAHDA
jgi:tetratricopeptide (TPR) repeat protein